ncbi:transporter substrate-binding domain-containing protein [Mesorhizobium sp. SB112]|uniref:transporter substrate-binding domain-containing protein n=1 Tax=Mesorhizobium sp. SB112 TaxID=3151853 RepID=UPI003264A25E
MKLNSILKRTVIALTLGAAISTVVPSAQAFAANDHFKEILERGVLRVGVLGAFKPWAYRAPDGSLEGIELDLAKNVADTLGVELEPVVVTSANRMEFLQQGKIDLIIGGMYDTEERRKVIGVIEPAYWTSGPTLMAKKGIIKSWDDIAGKPICAKQGVYYNKLAETEYKAKVVAFAGNTEGKEALRSGKCVAWIYDDASIMADLASGEWDDYEMPVPVVFNNPWGAAVPTEDRDGAWGVFVSGMTYRWHATGYLQELEKKWGVRPSEWIAQQHEKHQWDSSYLKSN